MWPANAEEQRVLGQCFKCLKDWAGGWEGTWRFGACFLPVLVNGLPAAGLRVWYRTHSTACIVALGQALILHHWTFLYFATGFVRVQFECCSRLAHPCLSILLPACNGVSSSLSDDVGFPLRGWVPPGEPHKVHHCSFPWAQSSGHVPRWEHMRPTV